MKHVMSWERAGKEWNQYIMYNRINKLNAGEKAEEVREVFNIAS